MEEEQLKDKEEEQLRKIICDRSIEMARGEAQIP